MRLGFYRESKYLNREDGWDEIMKKCETRV